MKRTTARALTVATSLAVAGAVAGAGTLSATVVAAPAVEAASFTTTPASYVVNDALAPSTTDRSTFAERASRDKARKAAHLKKLRAAKAKKAAREAHRAAVLHAKAMKAKAAKAAKARASVSESPVISGSPRAIGKRMAASRGWTGSQWNALENLWTAESNWGVTSGSTSGAYGIPQSLPGTKMSSAGSDWRTNPATQIEWGLNYISSRWGTPAAAWSHFQAVHWY